MTEFVGCVECGAAAEVRDRQMWPSTDGRVEHVRTVCVNRHWLYYPSQGCGNRPHSDDPPEAVA